MHARFFSLALSACALIAVADDLFSREWKKDVNEHDAPLDCVWKPCGNPEVCTCCNITANCSWHENDSLKYIPELPAGILDLTFAHNSLDEIPGENFFENVTNITRLDLGANNLTRINGSAFRRLKHLRHLKLDHNHFTHTDNFSQALVKTLEFLQVIGVGLQTISTDMFIKNPTPNLTVLFLHDNELTEVDLKTFDPLTKLQNLGIADSYISVFRRGGLLRYVWHMVLETNVVRRFPETCTGDSENSSLYPNLTSLNLDFNFIRYLPKVCLPKLSFLSLNGNAFVYFNRYSFSKFKFPNLQILRLESLRAIRYESAKQLWAHAFTHPHLQSLTLMYNNIDFDDRAQVNRSSFAGCGQLKQLFLDHNYLTRPETFVELFNDSKSLTKVALSNVGLQGIKTDTFAGFPSLRNLSLHRNRLTELPDGAFDTLKKLTYLDLSNNIISSIQEKTFGPDTRSRLHHLDLGSNNSGFNCDCDLVWFSQWLSAAPDVFRSDFSYDCANVPSTKVTSFVISEQQCLLSHYESSITFAASGILTLAFVCFVIYYRYRWHIRLVLFDAFRSRNVSARWRRLQQQHFEYDLFVCYASEDLSWVQSYLMPELEDRLKLRLCIHERNFIPGTPIVDNIAECVEKSKKVLMLFSTNFARSPWCQFELAFCLSHVLDNDDFLVIACLHYIPSRDLTTAMMALYKTTTYIQWASSEDARRCFWGRLRIALHEVIPLDRRLPIEC